MYHNKVKVKSKLLAISCYPFSWILWLWSLSVKRISAVKVRQRAAVMQTGSNSQGVARLGRPLWWICSHLPRVKEQASAPIIAPWGLCEHTHSHTYAQAVKLDKVIGRGVTAEDSEASRVFFNPIPITWHTQTLTLTYVDEINLYAWILSSRTYINNRHMWTESVALVLLSQVHTC